MQDGDAHELEGGTQLIQAARWAGIQQWAGQAHSGSGTTQCISSQPAFSELGGNQLRWEYLHHGNQQALQIRVTNTQLSA